MKFYKFALIGSTKAGGCPFGFDKNISDDVRHHPKVQTGENYLSEIYTCPAGAKS